MTTTTSNPRCIHCFQEIHSVKNLKEEIAKLKLDRERDRELLRQAVKDSLPLRGVIYDMNMRLQEDE